jgi:hypothetical protein
MEIGRQVETVDSQIETLARELAKRDGRGGGRATAIIGAGFSRNANPQSGSRRKFPLWRDIVRPLIDELVPPCSRCPVDGLCPVDAPPGCKLAPRRRALFEDASGASGMMSLGDKFEAQRGKARLRAALKTAVPDEDYVPGKAHQLLVRLPWADIFTTNWDTLLERAVDAYDRSYDTVVTVEQIASTSSPRIVKLHGCVRAGTPLIFTEEDFRTYPATFAPFVSLVQQSLMENVVVLFGFSGADPNFRAWHGWVRDHLGRHTQPLYMVTLQPTDAVDVHLMSRRLINPIDLSSKWRNVDANVMIENFLFEINRRLRSLRDNLDWPSSRSVPRDHDPSGGPATDLKDWKRRIEAYPRWLVAPARNRADLLASLDEAVLLVLDPDKGIPAPINALAALKQQVPSKRNRNNAEAFIDDRAQAACVVAESLRIALARPADTLFAKLSEILAEILIDLLDPNSSEQARFRDTDQMLERLEAILRKSEVTELTGDGGGSDGEAARVEKLTNAGEALLAIDERGLRQGVIRQLVPVFEVVEREARLRGRYNVARALRGVLLLASGDDQGRELALRSTLASALAELDLAAVDSLLALWPDQPHDAASNLRHTAALREIGRFAEAEKEIESIVNRLRSLGSSRRRDIGEASREAWAFYLYADLLEANQHFLRTIIERRHKTLTLNEVITELHERLDELETRGRDPRREIDRLARDLESTTNQARLARIAGQSVPPRYRHVIADPASTFVIFSETVGLAVDLAYAGSRLALNAARLLAPSHRELAIGLLLRAGTPEDLPFVPDAKSKRITMEPTDEGWLVAEIVFDKQRTQDDVQKLGRVLERLVAPAPNLTKLGSDPDYLDRKVCLLLHLIAGLIARAPTNSSAKSAFELACKVAHSPVVIATGAGWSNLPLLFHRSLEQLVGDEADGSKILTNLIDLPLPGDTDESRASGWPDPFRLLVRVLNSELNAGTEPTRVKIRPLGVRLIERAREGLKKNSSSISHFREKIQTLNAIALGCGPERRKPVQRRLEVLKAVLNGFTQTPVQARARPDQARRNQLRRVAAATHNPRRKSKL